MMFPAKERYKSEKWKYNFLNKILQPLSIVILFKITFLTVWTVETLSLRFRGDFH